MARKKPQEADDDLTDIKVDFGDIAIPEVNLAALGFDTDEAGDPTPAMETRYIGTLDMVLSIYFYGHERWQLIPHLYKSLDKDNRFQLAIAGIHTKIIFFETHEGQKIVIHGSANLRSSVNVEQFTIEENPELYDFYADCFSKVMERYATIKKPLLANDLWKVITTKRFNNP